MRAAWLPCLPGAILLALYIDPAGAQEDDREYRPLIYGERGVEFRTRDESTFLWFGVRVQPRYSDLQGTPVDPARLAEQEEEEADFNRARLKLGGHVFAEWLDVYTEYSIVNDVLLDYRVTLKSPPGIDLRAGQWKIVYNRERVDSSGAQQHAERSISNYWFTIDRQQGIALNGRLGEGRWYDSSIWVSAATGSGRGGDRNGNSMRVLRYQWNFTRSELGFSQSDIGRRQEPAGSVSIGWVVSHTPFTRFSSSGGGQLPGFPSDPGQRYRIEQYLLETAWQGRGLSWQQELHWKEIRDPVADRTRRLTGGYAQLGYFFHESFEFVPEPLELAARVSRVDPERGRDNDLQTEITVSANWFFNGHRNKLTADYSWIRLDHPTGAGSENRLRLQWDFSF